jgi:hypothetical protein
MLATALVTTEEGTPASTSAATVMSPAIPDVGSRCKCWPRKSRAPPPADVVARFTDPASG